MHAAINDLLFHFTHEDCIMTLLFHRAGDYKLIDGYPGLYPDWYKPDQVYDFGPEPTVKDMQAHAGRYQLYNLKGDMIKKFFSLDEMKAN